MLDLFHGEVLDVSAAPIRDCRASHSGGTNTVPYLKGVDRDRVQSGSSDVDPPLIAKYSQFSLFTSLFTDGDI